MLSSQQRLRYRQFMRSLLPLFALLLAGCNADQPQAADDTALSQTTAVQDKANADVDAAMAEAR